MRNFYTFIVSIFFSSFFGIHAFCQGIKVDTVALREELKAMSSDELVAELRSMLDSMGKPTSFISVNAGMSNSLFSARNNAFNANQSSTSATAFIPSVSYFHKSGFGLGASGYVRSFGQSPTLYQTALTPSYDHFGKQFLYGISYSHYIRSNNPNVTTTPYKQEVYAYAQWRSAWLRPSLSVGWGGGNYKDVSMIPIKISGDEVLIVDTSLVNLNDFSLIASVGHHFNFSDLITANDIFTINPQLSLIGGMQQYDSRTISRKFFGERFRESEMERIRKRYNNSSSSTMISLETAAFSMNFSWFKGALSVNAGYFMGYYFDPAATRRFSHIFNTGIGLTF